MNFTLARPSRDRTNEDQILPAGDRRRKPRSSDGWVPAARAELFRVEPEPSLRFIKPKLRLKLGSFSSRAEPEPSFFRAEPEPSPSSLARYQPYYMVHQLITTNTVFFLTYTFPTILYYNHFTKSQNPFLKSVNFQNGLKPQSKYQNV